MSEPQEIEALRAMNRAVEPSAEADERIRSLITAAVDERASILGVNEQGSGVAADEPFRPPVSDHDISAFGAKTEPTPQRSRWNSAVVLRAAAAVLVVVGLVFAATTIGDDEPTRLVAADRAPSELTSGERICTGAYGQLADQWKQILDATAPGFAVDLPRDRLELLLESQHQFLDSLIDELESGRMVALADPETLVAALAAVEETQAAFEMRGATDSIASVGLSHRLLAQLIDENPQLNEFCDAAEIAWPQ